MRRVALTFFFLILGATVSFCQAAAQQRTVGVISTIGETFTLQKVGIMVFGNESNDAAIDSWGIDDLVSKKVAALLSGRFAVKKINTSKGAFAYLERPGFDPFRDRDGEFRALVQKIATSQGCDLVVVIRKAESRYGTTNQTVSGLGMATPSNLMGSHHLYALSAISVFDGRTFEVLREQRASIGQNTLFAEIIGPHREVAASDWPTGPVAQNQPIRSATWQLLDQSLAATIPALFETN
jgi:hypothetical protein